MPNNTTNNDKTMPTGDDRQKNAALNPGDTLGQYKIIRLLGRGGMGEVYEVEHTVLHKNFAIKLLPSDFAKKREALERLQREAEVMARLDHPNLLTVDDFGETNGRYWLRMELIDTLTAEDEAGKRCDVGSLQELADFCNGKIPEDVLLPIIKQVTEGVAYAHEKGAVHRDLKPGNILLEMNADTGGTPTAKITDFGLVRVVGEEWMRSQAQMSVSQSMSLGDQATEAPSGGTSTKALLGTYDYMSPEQRNGKEADKRSDVYALGLMIFRLLTGHKELSFDLPSQIDQSLHPNWDEIVRKCLRPDSEERPGNGYKLLQMLKKLEQPSDNTNEVPYGSKYSGEFSKPSDPNQQTTRTTSPSWQIQQESKARSSDNQISSQEFIKQKSNRSKKAPGVDHHPKPSEHTSDTKRSGQNSFPPLRWIYWIYCGFAFIIWFLGCVVLLVLAGTASSDIGQAMGGIFAIVWALGGQWILFKIGEWLDTLSR